MEGDYKEQGREILSVCAEETCTRTQLSITPIEPKVGSQGKFTACPLSAWTLSHYCITLLIAASACSNTYSFSPVSLGQKLGYNLAGSSVQGLTRQQLSARGCMIT